MKIVWITNITIPLIAEQLNQPPSVFGGWLDVISRKLVDHYQMVFISPGQTNEKKSFQNCTYYSFSEGDNTDWFYSIITDEKPDVIHQFGTESGYVIATIEAYKKTHYVDRVIISIQGLIYAYAYHYLANLPHHICLRFGLYEFLKRKNLYRMKNSFTKRGVNEIKVLQSVKHVQGRTEWDRVSTNLCNHQLTYHFCNEALREVFYDKKWEISKAEPYRVFVSQCNYPIKGFHFLVEALRLLKPSIPKIHVYTTGEDIINPNLKNQLHMSSYHRYLRSLILKHGMKDSFTFLGSLSAEQMCNQLIQANLFISPSTIENSPNSLGEAMLIGCPVIASRVGGVETLIDHNKEGFLYQHDAPYLLAYYIRELIQHPEKAVEFSTNAQKRANKTHDREAIYQRQVEIYKNIQRSSMNNMNISKVNNI